LLPDGEYRLERAGARFARRSRKTVAVRFAATWRTFQDWRRRDGDSGR
jgi:hypothetical protein